MNSWNRWLWVFSSNFALFFTLLILSYIFYLIFLRPFKAKLSSAYFTMAVAMVAFISLSSFDIPKAIVKLISMEIIIIWLYLVANLIESYLSEELLLDTPHQSLSLGILVTGTIIPLILFIQVEPTLYGFILLQAMLAIFFWGVYCFKAFEWLKEAFYKHLHLPTDGKIFLVALSMQAMVVLLNELFNEPNFKPAYQILILFGGLYYFIGIYILLRYNIITKSRHWLAGWSQENVLIYAASAMMGIAILNTESFPEWVVTVFWQWTLLCFVIVEVLELNHLGFFLKKKPFSQIFIYQSKQWARVFALAALYAFNMIYHMPYADAVSTIISDYGIYLVILLCLIQMLILLLHIIRTRFFYAQV